MCSLNEKKKGLLRFVVSEWSTGSGGKERIKFSDFGHQRSSRFFSNTMQSCYFVLCPLVSKVGLYTIFPVLSESPGLKAAHHGLGPPPHFHDWDIQHHRRVGHGRVERDSPQDRVWLQPDRPRLPWPKLLGQRLDWAVGPGCWRGQSEGLRGQPHWQPATQPSILQRTLIVHDRPAYDWQLLKIWNVLQKWLNRSRKQWFRFMFDLHPAVSRSMPGDIESRMSSL